MLRNSEVFAQYFPFERSGSRKRLRPADVRIFRRYRCNAAPHRGDLGAIAREAKEFCDVIGRRNPDFEKERSGRAALFVGLARRKWCAMRLGSTA